MQIEDMTKKLGQNHVISFQNKKIESSCNWAGYSPANGRFWVNGANFQKAEEAAREMSRYGIENWIEVDQCIDEDEEVA